MSWKKGHESDVESGSASQLRAEGYKAGAIRESQKRENPLDYLFSDILKGELQHPLHQFVEDAVYRQASEKATSCIKLSSDSSIIEYHFLEHWTKSFLDCLRILLMWHSEAYLDVSWDEVRPCRGKNQRETTADRAPYWFFECFCKTDAQKKIGINCNLLYDHRNGFQHETTLSESELIYRPKNTKKTFFTLRKQILSHAKIIVRGYDSEVHNQVERH